MKTIEKITPGTENQVVGPKINAHRLDELGREIVDSRVIQPPVGFVEQPSMFEQMRQMMRAASLEAAMAGNESLEEANDFYIEDDPLSGVPPSEYEFDEDHQRELEEFLERRKQPREAVEPAPAPKSPRKAPKASESPPEPSEGGSGGDD